MTKSKKISAATRALSLGMAFIFTYVNVIYGALEPAKSFWLERKAAAQRTSHSGESSQEPGAQPQERTLLAQLPSADFNALTNNLPRIQSLNDSISPEIISRISSEQGEGGGAYDQAARRLPDWVKAIPVACVNFRDFYLPPGWNPEDPIILHIQDAHQNFEAQSNIARVIESLNRADASSLPGGGARELSGSGDDAGVLVGIEGAAGAFDFEAYRSFPDKPFMKDLAGHFLKSHFITGPEYVGFTAETPPLFWGVENKELYLKNVKAFKDSVPREKEFKVWLESLAASVEALKDKVFREELKELDRNSGDYRQGRESLGAYLSYLNPGRAAEFPNARLFAEAAGLEKSLDYKKVESERSELLGLLTRRCSKPDLQNLVSASLSYRMGNLTYVQFYRYLKELTRAYGLSLSRWEELEKYVRYVTVSEKIRPEGLFSEIDVLEKKRRDAIVKSPDESELLQLSADVLLLEKLSRFGLSPKDWEAYLAQRDSIRKIGGRLSDLASYYGTRLDKAALLEADKLESLLQPCETFNRTALERNGALAGNLLEKIEQERKKSKSAERAGKNIKGPRVAVLVTGGFHTDGITQILKDKGIGYAVLSPKLGKVEGDGTGYLEIFKRDKTPLEKVFSGERITLAGESGVAVANIGEPPAKVGAMEGEAATLGAGRIAFNNVNAVTNHNRRIGADIQTQVSAWMESARAHFKTVQDVWIKVVEELRDGKKLKSLVSRTQTVKKDGRKIPLIVETSADGVQARSSEDSREIANASLSGLNYTLRYPKLGLLGDAVDFLFGRVGAALKWTQKKYLAFEWTLLNFRPRNPFKGRALSPVPVRAKSRSESARSAFPRSPRPGGTMIWLQEKVIALSVRLNAKWPRFPVVTEKSYRLKVAWWLENLLVLAVGGLIVGLWNYATMGSFEVPFQDWFRVFLTLFVLGHDPLKALKGDPRAPPKNLAAAVGIAGLTYILSLHLLPLIGSYSFSPSYTILAFFAAHLLGNAILVLDSEDVDDFAENSLQESSETKIDATDIGVVGVIGLGRQGRRYLNELSKFKAKVHGVDSYLDEESVEKYRDNDQWNLEKADAEAVFGNPEVKAVIIVTPGNTHYEMVKRALLAGKHVLIEKPFTPTTAEAEELVALANQRNLRIMVGHNRFYLPHYQRLKELANSGKLGKILSVEGNYCMAPQKNDTTHTALEGIGYHQLYMIHGVLNRDHPTKVVSAAASENWETVGVKLLYDDIPVTIKLDRVSNEPKTRNVIVRGDKYTAIFDFAPEPAYTRLIVEPADPDNFDQNELDALRDLAVFNGDEKEPSLYHQLKVFFDTVRTQEDPPSNGSAAISIVKSLEDIRDKLKASPSSRFYSADYDTPEVIVSLAQAMHDKIGPQGGVVTVDGPSGVGKSTLSKLLAEFYQLRYPSSRRRIIVTEFDEIRLPWDQYEPLKKRILGKELTEEELEILKEHGWADVQPGRFEREYEIWRLDRFEGDLNQLSEFFKHAREGDVTTVVRNNALDPTRRHVIKTERQFRYGDIIIFEGKYTNLERFARYSDFRVRISDLASKIHERFRAVRTKFINGCENNNSGTFQERLRSHLWYYFLSIVPTWVQYYLSTEGKTIDVEVDLSEGSLRSIVGGVDEGVLQKIAAEFEERLDVIDAAFEDDGGKSPNSVVYLGLKLMQGLGLRISNRAVRGLGLAGAFVEAGVLSMISISASQMDSWGIFIAFSILHVILEQLKEYYGRGEPVGIWDHLKENRFNIVKSFVTHLIFLSPYVGISNLPSLTTVFRAVIIHLTYDFITIFLINTKTEKELQRESVQAVEQSIQNFKSNINAMRDLITDRDDMEIANQTEVRILGHLQELLKLTQEGRIIFNADILLTEDAPFLPDFLKNRRSTAGGIVGRVQKTLIKLYAFLANYLPRVRYYTDEVVIVGMPGTFDPPHLNHLDIVLDSFVNAAKMDRGPAKTYLASWYPAGDDLSSKSGDKWKPSKSKYEDRFEMTRLLASIVAPILKVVPNNTRDHPGDPPLRTIIELAKMTRRHAAGKKPHVTVLHARGSDTFNKWAPQEEKTIFNEELPGITVKTLLFDAPEYTIDRSVVEGIAQEVIVLPHGAVGYRSSQIRKMDKFSLLPVALQEFIRKHNLYRNKPGPIATADATKESSPTQGGNDQHWSKLTFGQRGEESIREFDGWAQEAFLKDLEQTAGERDLTVVIPFYKEYETLPNLVKQVESGLRERYPDRKVLIMVMMESFCEMPKDLSDDANTKVMVFNKPANFRGKEWAVRGSLLAADRLGTDFMVLDADMAVSEDWVDKFLRPLLEGTAKCVSPVYQRSWTLADQAVQDLLVRPVLDAVYESDEPVYQWVGGEVALHKSLVKVLLDDHDVFLHGMPLESYVAGCAIEVAGADQVAQVALGKKENDFTVADPDHVASRFPKYARVIFRQMSDYLERQGRTTLTYNERQALAVLPAQDNSDFKAMDLTEADIRAWIKVFKDSFPANEAIYKRHLPEFFPWLQRLSQEDEASFRMDGHEWGKILSAVYAAYGPLQGHVEKNRLLEAAAPIFMARAASFAREADALGPEKIEKKIREQTRDFVTEFNEQAQSRKSAETLASGTMIWLQNIVIAVSVKLNAFWPRFPVVTEESYRLNIAPWLEDGLSLLAGGLLLGLPVYLMTDNALLAFQCSYALSKLLFVLGHTPWIAHLFGAPAPPENLRASIRIALLSLPLTLLPPVFAFAAAVAVHKIENMKSSGARRAPSAPARLQPAPTRAIAPLLTGSPEEGDLMLVKARELLESRRTAAGYDLDEASLKTLFDLIKNALLFEAYLANMAAARDMLKIYLDHEEPSRPGHRIAGDAFALVEKNISATDQTPLKAALAEIYADGGAETDPRTGLGSALPMGFHVGGKIVNGRLVGGTRVAELSVKMTGIQELLVSHPDAVVTGKKLMSQGELYIPGLGMVWHHKSGYEHADGVTVVFRGGRVWEVYDKEGREIYGLTQKRVSCLHLRGHIENGRLVGGDYVHDILPGIKNVGEFVQQNPDAIYTNVPLNKKGGLSFLGFVPWDKKPGYENKSVTVVFEKGELTEAYGPDGETLYVKAGDRPTLRRKRSPVPKPADARQPAEKALLARIYVKGTIENGRLAGGYPARDIRAGFKDADEVLELYTDAIFTDVTLNGRGGLILLGFHPWDRKGGYEHKKVTVVRAGGKWEKVYGPNGEQLYPEQMIEPPPSAEAKDDTEGLLDRGEVERLVHNFGLRAAYRILLEYHAAASDHVRNILKRYLLRRNAGGLAYRARKRQAYSFLSARKMEGLPQTAENEDALEFMTREVSHAVYNDAVKAPAFLEMLLRESRDPLNSEFLREVYRRVYAYYIDLSRFEVRRIDESKRSLKLYQKEGIRFIIDRKKVVLADDQGLGKTIQVLGAALNIRDGAGARKALILCPFSAKEVWKKEIKDYTLGGQSVFVINEPKDLESPVKLAKLREARFVIVNYELLRGLRKDLRERLRSQGFDFIAADEAHRMRNEALQTQVIREFRAEYQVLVTGTPLVGRKVGKLFNLLNWLYPERFSNRKVFSRQYGADGGRLRQLGAELDPFVLRRLKNDVYADFPEKRHTVHYVELKGLQRELYERLNARLEEFLQRMRNGEKADPKHILRLFKALHQTALDPALYDYRLILGNEKHRFSFFRGEGQFSLNGRTYKVRMSRRSTKDVILTDDTGKEYKFILGGLHNGRKGLSIRLDGETFDLRIESEDYDLAKLEVLDRIIADAVARGQSIVVFTTYRDMVLKLKERYRHYGVHYLIGGMNAADRQSEIDAFQRRGGVLIKEKEEGDRLEAADQGKVLLATFGAGGESITLTRASEIALLDQPWTAQERNQAVDRVHRLGQERDVMVHTLIAKGTIDEYMEEAVLQSDLVSRLVLDDDPMASDSEDDLIEAVLSAMQYPKDVIDAIRDYRGRVAAPAKEAAGAGVQSLAISEELELLPAEDGAWPMKARVLDGDGQVRFEGPLLAVVPMLSDGSRRLLRDFLAAKLRSDFVHEVPYKESFLWALICSLQPNMKDVDFNWEWYKNTEVSMAIVNMLLENESVTQDEIVDAFGDVVAVQKALQFMDTHKVFMGLSQLGVLSAQFFYNAELLRYEVPLRLSILNGNLFFRDESVVEAIVPGRSQPPFNIADFGWNKMPSYERLEWPSEQRRLAREAKRGNLAARDALIYDSYADAVRISRNTYTLIHSQRENSAAFVDIGDLYAVGLSVLAREIPKLYNEAEERDLREFLVAILVKEIALYAHGLANMSAQEVKSLDAPAFGEETDETAGERFVSEGGLMSEKAERDEEKEDAVNVFELVSSTLKDAGFRPDEIEIFFRYAQGETAREISADLRRSLRYIQQDVISQAIDVLRRTDILLQLDQAREESPASGAMIWLQNIVIAVSVKLNALWPRFPVVTEESYRLKVAWWLENFVSLLAGGLLLGLPIYLLTGNAMAALQASYLAVWPLFVLGHTPLIAGLFGSRAPPENLQASLWIAVLSLPFLLLPPPLAFFAFVMIHRIGNALPGITDLFQSYADKIRENALFKRISAHVSPKGVVIAVFAVALVAFSGTVAKIYFVEQFLTHLPVSYAGIDFYAYFMPVKAELLSGINPYNNAAVTQLIERGLLTSGHANPTIDFWGKMVFSQENPGYISTPFLLLVTRLFVDIPYVTALNSWFIMNTVGVVAFIYLFSGFVSKRILGKKNLQLRLLSVVFMAFGFSPVLRTLLLGQINIPVLILTGFGIVSYFRSLEEDRKQEVSGETPARFRPGELLGSMGLALGVGIKIMPVALMGYFAGKALVDIVRMVKSGNLSKKALWGSGNVRFTAQLIVWSLAIGLVTANFIGPEIILDWWHKFSTLPSMTSIYNPPGVPSLAFYLNYLFQASSGAFGIFANVGLWQAAILLLLGAGSVSIFRKSPSKEPLYEIAMVVALLPSIFGHWWYHYNVMMILPFLIAGIGLFKIGDGRKRWTALGMLALSYFLMSYPLPGVLAKFLMGFQISNTVNLTIFDPASAQALNFTNLFMGYPSTLFLMAAILYVAYNSRGKRASVGTEDAGWPALPGPSRAKRHPDQKPDLDRPVITRPDFEKAMTSVSFESDLYRTRDDDAYLGLYKMREQKSAKPEIVGKFVLYFSPDEVPTAFENLLKLMTPLGIEGVKVPKYMLEGDDLTGMIVYVKKEQIIQVGEALNGMKSSKGMDFKSEAQTQRDWERPEEKLSEDVWINLFNLSVRLFGFNGLSKFILQMALSKQNQKAGPNVSGTMIWLQNIVIAVSVKLNALWPRFPVVTEESYRLKVAWWLENLLVLAAGSLIVGLWNYAAIGSFEAPFQDWFRVSLALFVLGHDPLKALKGDPRAPPQNLAAAIGIAGLSYLLGLHLLPLIGFSAFSPYPSLLIFFAVHKIGNAILNALSKSRWKVIAKIKYVFKGTVLNPRIFFWILSNRKIWEEAEGNHEKLVKILLERAKNRLDSFDWNQDDLGVKFEDHPDAIVIGDLHGDLEGLLLMLLKMGVIDQDGKWDENNKKRIVFVGDAALHGPFSDSVDRFLKELQEGAGKEGDAYRVTRLCGNNDLRGAANGTVGIYRKFVAWLYQFSHVDAVKHPEMQARILADIQAGKIEAAIVRGGVLYTHTGLTETYRRGIGMENKSPEEIALRLNKILQESVESGPENDWEYGIFSEISPINTSQGELVADPAVGIPQGFGHTPNADGKPGLVKNDRGETLMGFDTSRHHMSLRPQLGFAEVKDGAVLAQTMRYAGPAEISFLPRSGSYEFGKLLIFLMFNIPAAMGYTYLVEYLKIFPIVDSPLPVSLPALAVASFVLTQILKALKSDLSGMTSVPLEELVWKAGLITAMSHLTGQSPFAVFLPIFLYFFLAHEIRAMFFDDYRSKSPKQYGRKTFINDFKIDLLHFGVYMFMKHVAGADLLSSLTLSGLVHLGINLAALLIKELKATSSGGGTMIWLQNMVIAVSVKLNALWPRIPVVTEEIYRLNIAPWLEDGLSLLAGGLLLGLPVYLMTDNALLAFQCSYALSKLLFVLGHTPWIAHLFGAPAPPENLRASIRIALLSLPLTLLPPVLAVPFAVFIHGSVNLELDVRGTASAAQNAVPGKLMSRNLELLEAAALEQGASIDPNAVLPSVQSVLKDLEPRREVEILQARDRLERLAASYELMRLADAFNGSAGNRGEDSGDAVAPEDLPRVMEYLSESEWAAASRSFRQLYEKDPRRAALSFDAFSRRLFAAGGRVEGTAAPRMDFEQTFTAYLGLRAAVAPQESLSRARVQEMKEAARAIWDAARKNAADRARADAAMDLKKYMETASLAGDNRAEVFNVSGLSDKNLSALAQAIKLQAGLEPQNRSFLVLFTNRAFLSDEEIAALRLTLQRKHGVARDVFDTVFADLSRHVVTGSDLTRVNEAAADPSILVDPEQLYALVLERMRADKGAAVAMDIYTDEMIFSQSWSRFLNLRILMLISQLQAVPFLPETIGSRFESAAIFALQA